MAKALLVGPALDEGLRYIELLKKDGIPVRAAVWHRPPLTNWRLSIISPSYDTKGLGELYQRTRAIFAKAEPQLGFDLDNIYFPMPNSSFAKILRESFRGWENQECTIYDMEGDPHEAFIYFVK